MKQIKNVNAQKWSGEEKCHHVGYCAFKPGGKPFLDFIIRAITPVLGHVTRLALGLWRRSYLCHCVFKRDLRLITQNHVPLKPPPHPQPLAYKASFGDPFHTSHLAGSLQTCLWPGWPCQHCLQMVVSRTLSPRDCSPPGMILASFISLQVSYQQDWGWAVCVILRLHSCKFKTLQKPGLFSASVPSTPVTFPFPLQSPRNAATLQETSDIFPLGLIPSDFYFLAPVPSTLIFPVILTPMTISRSHSS